MFGCAGQPDETDEIVGNLVKAGFPADDIMVLDGKVYAGRDAEVSLAASREMLGRDDTTEEQYRTTNLVSTSLSKICINGSTFTGAFSMALDLAIQNYEELPLTFAMARTPSSGCSFTIDAVLQPGLVGGSAGFPSGGLPYSTINIGDGLAPYGVDVIEHVITHEIGHTLGLRHSDYYNRSISCGTGGDEGDAGIGAIHIPGTPATATTGGSLMNSCFRSVETGEFAPGDVSALMTLYTTQENWNGALWTTAYSDINGWAATPAFWQTIRFPDLNGDGKADVCGRAGDGLFCGLSTGTGFTGTSLWTTAYGDAAGWASTPAYWQTIQFPDLNGDGKADVCGRAGDGLYCGLSTGTGFTGTGLWTTAYSDINGWAATPAFWQTIRFPDLNGDGKADVCGRAGDGLFCGLSTGTGFTGTGTWTTAYGDAAGWASTPAYWQTIQFPDLNGDGKADVCGRSPDGLYCGLSTGTGFTGIGLWTTAYSDINGWAATPAFWQTIRFPDLNGDGKADVCGRAGDGLFCGLSTGTGFTGTSLWTTAYGDAAGWASTPAYWQTIQFPDLNGDGKADVCGRAGDGLYCGLSTGTGFTGTGNWATAYSNSAGWANTPAYWQTIQFQDFNADGRVDACGRAPDGILCVVK